MAVKSGQYLDWWRFSLKAAGKWFYKSLQRMTLTSTMKFMEKRKKNRKKNVIIYFMHLLRFISDCFQNILGINCVQRSQLKCWPQVIFWQRITDSPDMSRCVWHANGRRTVLQTDTETATPEMRWVVSLRYFMSDVRYTFG